MNKIIYLIWRPLIFSALTIFITIGIQRHCEAKRGCLYNKTVEQKIKYFESLAGFIISDHQFFKEQYQDLQLNEKRQFVNWLFRNIEE